MPLIGALVMAQLFGNMMFLAFAILSPVSLVATHFVDKRQGRRTQARTFEEYLQRRESIASDVADALAAEQQQRRHECPDPAEVAAIGIGPRQRLWERRRRDPDWALLRIGTGSLPSGVTLTDPDREEHHRRVEVQLHEVPVTVPLTVHGVLGIAGRSEQARALARWLIAQSRCCTAPRSDGVCAH